MTRRAIAVAALLLVSAVCAAESFRYASSVYEMDIPAQRLPDALQTLANTTGVTVIYGSHDVQTVRTHPVEGRLTVGQALRHMLAGTGLTHRLDANAGRVVILSRAMAR